MSGWCQRWSAGTAHWRHTSEGGFDRRRYEVAALREREARAFVEQNHYLASYPAAVRAYGLYDGAWLVGVAVLSIPVQRRVLEVAFPGLEPYVESVELGRFVLAEAVPANGESWFLARVFEREAAAGMRGVVSFADPLPRAGLDGRVVTPGHVGTIYQASNATYLGRATARTINLLPDGRVLNERSLQKLRAGERGAAGAERLLVAAGARARRPSEERREWIARALCEAHIRQVRHPGNHRYAFAVGPGRRQVALGAPGLAYPKVVG